MKATLLDGSFHQVDSSDMAFRICASVAFKQAFMNADRITSYNVCYTKLLRRINEIRNRFGLGSKNVSGKVTGTDSKISFEKMKNDAISSLKSGVEKNSITKTVSGVKSLNPSELYSEKNRISASLLSYNFV